MSGNRSYFFCGVGGSGMLPLALILKGQGHRVAGSDRALDQGRTGAKFDYLRRAGVELFRQDGSGITDAGQILVTSAAVEESIPDVVAASALGCPHLTRPQLLAELVNAAPFSIAVGGTSGKSTVTGMTGWILHACGRAPTVMNGAVMKNFVGPDAPFASALVGEGEVFASEVDESDGSISLYRPTVAVLNNISLDHKSMEELRALFAGFLAAARVAVVNLDDAEAAALAAHLPDDQLLSYGFDREDAELRGGEVVEEPLAVRFEVTERASGRVLPVRLGVPGRHNAANALAALAAAKAAGIDLAKSVPALERFTGLGRRFDVVGTAAGVTVIDDFGHNPDKITATLNTLHAFPGRLLVMFQPHGYGPLKVMKDALIEALVRNLAPDDVLLMPDPVYFGGTVSREVGSADIVEGVTAAGRRAEHIPARNACADRLVNLARPGDRIIVMGARDDTLSDFAKEIVGRLAG